MSQQRRRATKKNLDKLVTAYLTHLFDEGEFSASAGSYLVYGLQLLRNSGPKPEFLPNSKEALAGWRKVAPGGMRLPVPEEFVFDMSLHAVEQERPDIAFAIVLQFDTYMRPLECLGLTVQHVGFPAGGRYNQWSIVIAPSTLGEKTKQGTSDESVLVADVADRHWLREAMRLYMKHVTHELFPDLTLSAYERWCAGAARDLKYKSSCIMPHIFRHSGASNDMFHKRRSLQEVQKRGRWAARNEKHALLLKRRGQAPQNRHSLIKGRSQKLRGALLTLLSC